MSESDSSAEPQPGRAGGAQPTFAPISIVRLASKELRETLRDRRTIMTLFLMPLLVYPILSLLFQGFIASGLKSSGQPTGGEGATEALQPGDLTDGSETESTPAPSDSTTDDSDETSSDSQSMQYVYLFESEEDVNRVGVLLNRGFVFRQRLDRLAKGESINDDDAIAFNLFQRHVFQAMPNDPGDDATLDKRVERGEADVGIRLRNRRGDSESEGLPSFELLYRENSPASQAAARLLSGIIDALNIQNMQILMARRGNRIPAPIGYTTVAIAPEAATAGISFAALVPLILTLMTITGAVYPAIDLTAGERERGTLESLVAAPIPRMRILVGKLVAIVAVAMLTAILNLTGMMVTIWVFQLDTLLFGESGLSLTAVLQILALLVLFAAFFSSVLLVITSFARSFKEGQAYLIPVMMVALAPSLMSLKPDLALTGLWAVTPLVNIVLLARDVLNGDAVWSSALVAVLSTVFYSVLALTLAARFFGTAKVLYGQDEGIATLFRRPRESVSVASASLALLCLALLFPASFLWQGLLMRFSTSSTEFVMLLAALGLVVVFALVPGILAWFHRVHLFSGFNVRNTSWKCYLAGILLGLGLGPLLMQAIASSGHWMEYLQSDPGAKSALLEQAEAQAERLRGVPWALVMLCFAVTPAVCEELFFRGLLFRSLGKTLSPAVTIIVTGLLFGTFHLITTSGLGLSRLIPTTLMGFALGWVCYKSASVLPGMILHAANNVLGLSLAYFRDDMVEWGWISEEQNFIPLEILALALGLTYIGFAMLHWKPGVVGNPSAINEYKSSTPRW